MALPFAAIVPTASAVSVDSSRRNDSGYAIGSPPSRRRWDFHQSLSSSAAWSWCDHSVAAVSIAPPRFVAKSEPPSDDANQISARHAGCSSRSGSGKRSCEWLSA